MEIKRKKTQQNEYVRHTNIDHSNDTTKRATDLIPMSEYEIKEERHANDNAKNSMPSQYLALNK